MSCISRLNLQGYLPRALKRSQGAQNSGLKLDRSDTEENKNQSAWAAAGRCLRGPINTEEFNQAQNAIGVCGSPAHAFTCGHPRRRKGAESHPNLIRPHHPEKHREGSRLATEGAKREGKEPPPWLVDGVIHSDSDTRHVHRSLPTLGWGREAVQQETWLPPASGLSFPLRRRLHLHLISLGRRPSPEHSRGASDLRAGGRVRLTREGAQGGPASGHRTGAGLVAWGRGRGGRALHPPPL